MWHGPIGWGMGLSMFVFCVGVIAFLVWAFQPRGERGNGSPLALLDRRYARGEIEDEEYERRRQRLEER